MADALKKSEDFQIEQTMLDDKLKATDWEATNEEIMELVAQESYIQWLKDNEKRSIGGSSGDIVGSTSHQRRQQDTNESSSSAAAAAMCSSWSHPSPTRTTTTTTTTTTTPIHHHNHHHHHHSSKQSPLLGATAATSMGVGGATAVTDLDDDSDILAQVLAASQQEYLDSLKAKRHQNRSS